MSGLAPVSDSSPPAAAANREISASVAPADVSGAGPRAWSALFARLLMESMISWIAAVFVVIHASQLLHLTFHAAFLLASIVSIGNLLVAAWRMRSAYVRSDRRWNTVALGALLLAAGSTLSITVHLPNSDDCYYGANANYYRLHPQERLTTQVRSFAFAHDVLRIPLHAVSVAYEYLAAFLAYATGATFLDGYYILLPAITGALMPLAVLNLLLSLGATERSALAGTFVVFCTWLVTVEAHRTPGNFALVRAFHGKAFVMTALLPWIAACSVRWFRDADRSALVALAFAGICSVGASPSGLVLVGALSLCLVGGGWAAGWIRPRSRRTAAYFAALGYLALFAVVVLGDTRAVGNSSPVNLLWPTTFLGHAAFLYEPRSPWTVRLGALALVGIFLLSGPARRFLLGWTATAGILFLNPLVSGFVIHYLTTSNIYWRLFYLLPFPAALGLCAARLWDWLESHRLGRVATIALAAMAIMSLPRFREQTVAQGAWWGLPGPKIERASLDLARAVARMAPPGPMLAAYPVGNVLPLISADHPQICTSVDRLDIQQWLWLTGHARWIGDRLAAVAAIEQPGGSPDALKRVIDQEGVVAVVAKAEIISEPEKADVLQQAGFVAAGEFSGWRILVRNGKGQRPGSLFE
ncbi:MAG: DUF6077 domain-containing protein [Planctomycetaceae bacterium]